MDCSQDWSPQELALKDRSQDCSPQKFSKKFFRVGVWGGFEWVGGIGNSGFVVGTVLGHHTPLSKSFSFLQM